MSTPKQHGSDRRHAWEPGSLFPYWEKSGRIIPRTPEEAQEAVADTIETMSNEEKYEAWTNYLGRMMEAWTEYEYGCDDYGEGETCPSTEHEAIIQLVGWMEACLNRYLDGEPEEEPSYKPRKKKKERKRKKRRAHKVVLEDEGRLESSE